MAKTQQNIEKKQRTKLRVIPLGGLEEIGKNMTVLEYGDDMIVIDCGMGFPDEEMPGVDYVIPDTTYLMRNAEKLRGFFITHGHEDHIGALPYVLQDFHVPVYATNLTIGVLKNKLSEHFYETEPDLHVCRAGETVRAGVFRVEFIHVNHSIADAVCFAVHTPVGTVVHSGDFKIDLTPVDGEVFDLHRLAQLGTEGVLLLMCESTNVERPGYSPSEKSVGASLEDIFFKNKDKRIIIATFSSNVHRVQQVINASAKYKRKVAITGRSMLNIVSAAIELGYMSVPKGVLIDISEMKRFKPEEITLITTGSQGEPMSALYRMACGEHDRVELSPQDLVVISASPIPGNEKLVDKIINQMCKRGVTVLHSGILDIHASGHACQEEIKMMHALLRPKYFMPIHGESRHLEAHRKLAVSMGMSPDHIFVPELGKPLELDRRSAKFGELVPAGRVLVDGYGVGDVGSVVLRDRRHLAQDGLIVVTASIDRDSHEILSGPDLISRGFVYVREAEELMDEIRSIATDSIQESLIRGSVDVNRIKNRVKEDLSEFLYSRTKRSPMILPVVICL